MSTELVNGIAPPVDAAAAPNPPKPPVEAAGAAPNNPPPAATDYVGIVRDDTGSALDAGRMRQTRHEFVMFTLNMKKLVW